MVLIAAWRFMDWQNLSSNAGLQHRFGFALVLLVCIWSIRAGVHEGLGIHFFMVTALHLVFGWQLAISAVFLSLIGMVWIGTEAWQGIGLNGWISGVVPILCTYGLWKLQRRLDLFNPFAFIFFVAFLGAIVSVLASGLLMTMVFTVAGVYELDTVIEQFWIFVPLIALPEATLNGMFVAGLIVFKPEWVALYDEERHLN